MGKTHYEGTPDKVVIIAGPTFGQALKFMIFGAAIGAGAIYYFLNSSKETTSTTSLAGAEAAKFEATTQSTTSEVSDRLGVLAERLKKVGSRAKSAVASASEAIKPTLQEALAEGKKAAAETQSKLKRDVDEAGDSPAIAEQDGELPSEKDDKFVE